MVLQLFLVQILSMDSRVIKVLNFLELYKAKKRRFFNGFFSVLGIFQFIFINTKFGFKHRNLFRRGIRILMDTSVYCVIFTFLVKIWGRKIFTIIWAR